MMSLQICKDVECVDTILTTNAGSNIGKVFTVLQDVMKCLH